MKIKLIYLALIICCTLTSCFSNKKYIYFSNIPKDTVTNIESQIPVTQIATNDILQITISSPDAETNTMMNMQSAVGGGSEGGHAGYLVDETGVVRIPLIGEIKAAGLTKLELSKKIADMIIAKKVAINPIVDVRIVNYKITVLGEVTNPGVKSIPNELITLPEVLGMAGDLTVYAQRNNVLLIREINGKRVSKRFSLNNSQMFDRDFYYLQNKDILYVEPNKAKAAKNNPIITQALPLLFSVAAFVFLLINQLK